LTKTKLHILLPDIHYPVHCKKSMRAVFQFIEAHRDQIESCVLTGDFLDCQNLSRHTKNRARLRQRGYKKDIDGFKRDILDPLDKLLKPSCKKYAICGNHEDWIQSDLLDEAPELEGVVDIPILLGLKDRKWEWVPCGGHIVIGKCTILHGDQIGSSIHVAKKLVESVHGTAVMSHVHRASMFTTTSLTSEKRKHAGYTLPCLCTVAPSYAKGQPNAFCNGFGLLEQGRTDMVNIYPVIIFPDGTCNYGGSVYGEAESKSKPPRKVRK